MPLTPFLREGLPVVSDPVPSRFQLLKPSHPHNDHILNIEVIECVGIKAREGLVIVAGGKVEK